MGTTKITASNTLCNSLGDDCMRERNNRERQRFKYVIRASETDPFQSNLRFISNSTKRNFANQVDIRTRMLFVQ